MSIRKRSWITSKGEAKEAWIVDYRDKQGSRHIETFDKKSLAVARHAEVDVKIRAGVHVARSTSLTIEEAGQQWLEASETAGLEASTVEQYEAHLRLHINPLIGGVKLADITTATVRDFQDQLRQAGRSPAMVSKVVSSLGALLSEALERGLVGRNACHELSRSKKQRARVQKRQDTRLEVGRDIPTLDEVRRIVAAASKRWRPLLTTAALTGLRLSELRGLRWRDVDLKAGEIQVRQRADKFHKIGPPKSAAGVRTVPIGKTVLGVLREWKLACPNGELGLAFPNTRGKIEGNGNILTRALIPACIAAGVVTRDGGAKYTGMHALRHFYASWCINRTEDGGLGLPPKVVQTRLGHSTISETMDTYGHLFPSGDDGRQQDAAEAALLAT
jgi:integrase